jgi:hypothetical protein
VGLTVGSEVEVMMRLGVGVAEAEQAAKRRAGKPRRDKKRSILAKGKVKTIGELSHGFSQKCIQIRILIFEKLFGDH